MGRKRTSGKKNEKILQEGNEEESRRTSMGTTGQYVIENRSFPAVHGKTRMIP